MLQLMSRFVDAAQRSLAQGVKVPDIASLPILRKLKRLGEDIGDDEIEKFEVLEKELDDAFGQLEVK